jgi:hypothetical protein
MALVVRLGITGNAKFPILPTTFTQKCQYILVKMKTIAKYIADKPQTTFELPVKCWLK